MDDRGTPVIKKMSRQVGGELDKLDKKARKSGKGFDKMKKDVDASGKGLSKFKGMMKSTMMQMAAGMGVMMGVQGAVRLISSTITDFIKTGREFEKTWANVTTMLTISEKETLKLKNQLIGLSPTLGSTTELAKGMYQVLSASIDPAKAVMFLGEAAKSAVAGVTDAFVAVDALTTVINAYGMAAEDVTKVSDIMFQTVKRGKLTYEGMAGALGTVVPIAAQVGIRFEAIGAAMATLTRQGVDVNTTTVQLRQIMVSVLKPTSMAETAAKKLGIQFNATTMRAMGLQKFLKYVMDAVEGDAEAMTSLFGNVRALTGIMGLAGKSAFEFASDLALMENASGSTEEAFKKQMKSLDFWIKTGTNALEKMKIAFYEGMVSPIRDIISSQEDLDSVFESMTSSAKLLGETIGSVGRAFKYIQPVTDLFLKAVGSVDRKIAALIEVTTYGWKPALSDMIQKEHEARVEANRLAESEKKLGENMKGVWGVMVRGYATWKQQVNWYIASGIATDEYLDALHKLWKGETKHQEVLKNLQAVENLGLLTVGKLGDKYDKLVENIKAAQASGLVYTAQLKSKAKEAEKLAEIMEIKLDPAIQKIIDGNKILAIATRAVKKETFSLASGYGVLVKQLESLMALERPHIGISAATAQNLMRVANSAGSAAVYLKGLDDVLKNLNASQGALVTTLDIYNEAIKQLKAESFGKEAIAWMPSPEEIFERMEVIKKALAGGELPPPDTDTFQTKLQKIGTYIGMATSQWDSMWNQMYQNQIQRIDNEYQTRKQAIDDSMASDQEKYFAIEKLDREMQKKRLAALRRQAVATKASSIIEATINTAVAFTAALKAGAIIGPILAGIIAAMGAAQIALIASQPLPSFAKGGVAGLHGPEVIMVGEEGPERITPLRDERPAVIVPSAAAGNRSVLFEANYYVTAMDATGVRDFVRDKAGPEMVEWIRLNKTEMLEALELE